MHRNRLLRIPQRLRTLPLCLLALLAAPAGLRADLTIVANGTPRASIVIAEDPPRLVDLAARELQAYIQKLSGAELPIGTQPDPAYPLTLYIGRSAFTDAQNLTDEGLYHGAYRMLSGPDWLVLLGRDRDYAPVEPRARTHGDRIRAQAEWEALTGGTWQNPMGRVYRDHHRPSGIWTHDEGGSLQAVYAFLRELGVRWFMPGELGEIVPQLETIALPVVDKTVTPDFPYRDLRLGNFTDYPWEDVLWHYRLGLNDQGLVEPHGMRRITSSEAMKAAHPEYYALVGSRRDTTTRGSGHACFSSEGLLRETIAYARAQFDHFDLPAVSVFPQDGYRHCGCELCKDKSPSEAVWTFVERVAQELYETHPDRIVLGGAYSVYRDPPETIERFSPNVAVRISWPRPGLDDDARWAEYWNFVEAWAARLAPQRLHRNANIHGTAARVFPILHPRSIARELSAMRGLSLGESSSVPRRPDQRWLRPGLSHLNLYVLSCFLWDAQTDLDALLDDYYQRFYGPAAEAMRKAFEFAESSYPRVGPATPARVDIADRVRFVELLHAARDIAGDTVHGRRIDVVIGDLQPLDELRELLAMDKARGDVRHFWTLMPADQREWGREGAVIDGKLDEPFWSAYRPGGSLSRSADGGRPQFGARFQMRWFRNHLYIGIRCEDCPDTPLNITATEDGDPAILEGDSVTVLIETQDHAYYEITVNPAGAVWDVDHAEGGESANWSSAAEVATWVGEGYWNVEMRIPVVDQDDDPLHWVIGRTPSLAFPWHFNIARRRIREDGGEWTAFEPTGSDDFHDLLHFVRVYLRPNGRIRNALREDGVRN